MSEKILKIQRITAKEYAQFFPNPPHVFNSVAFNELNKDKCIELHYLVFKDSKLRFGIILGEKEDCLRSPFSAPFGGLSSNKNERIEYYEQVVSLLGEYAKHLGKDVFVSLPPSLYFPTDNAKQISAFFRTGADLRYMDLNYQFEVKRFKNYESFIDSKSKNKLHNALKSNFQFVQLDSMNKEDVARAYSVIKRNREERGFPLRMSLEAVLHTIEIIPADFFVCTLDNIDMAAAQVFHVSEDTCQVIYWGDIPEYAKLRVMNFFTYKVFEYYYNKGIKNLDIGPSTEEGIPNYGLCEFKENIGCTVSSKYTFVLKTE